MHAFITSMVLAVTIATASAADVNRGKTLYKEGKYAEAATEIQGAVGENGDNAEAHRWLGMALIEQDRVDEAAKHISRAMELDGGGESKLALARLNVAQKNYDKAQELIGDASGDELEYVRGLIHFNKNQFEDAATDLEAAASKRPSNAYAHYYAGLAYNKLGKPDRMLSHFEMFVKLKPDAPEARKVRAVLKTGR
jgi:protein O-mannosyl-transferase